MRLNTYTAILVSVIFSFLFISNQAQAASPIVGTITPTSGTSNPNDTVTFTTTYTDLDGWANILYANLLINTSTNGANCFYGYYNQNTNRLYLRNDENTRWLGGYAPGSRNTIENSYVRLNCAGTRAVGLRGTLTVVWSITFKSSFAGTKACYLYVMDDTKLHNGWAKKGKWTIRNRTPSVGTINPIEGSSAIDIPVSFTTTYTDPDGWLNLQSAYLLINTSTSTTNCFYGYYNQNTNKLYLRNDANTRWLGGYSPGSANITENSYARLNCASSTVSGSGTTLTINWNISFKPIFAGTKNTYLYIKDDANAHAGFTLIGTWLIDATPPVGTITIDDGADYTNNTQITLTLSAEDPETGVIEMKFSKDNVEWSTPEPHNTTKEWILDPENGIKTIYVKYKNSVGLWLIAVSDNIMLDTIPPVDPSIDSVTSPTNQIIQVITGNKSVDTDRIIITCPTAVIGEVTYTTETTWQGEISNMAEGDNTINITAYDIAGNNSETIQATIAVDTTPPVINISSPQDGARFRIPRVTIIGTIDDYNAIVTSNGANGITEGGLFRIVDLPLESGNNQFTVTATDTVGNQANIQITIVYDTASLMPIWPMFRFDPQHTSQAPYTVTDINTLRWKTNAGGNYPILIDGEGTIHSGRKLLYRDGLLKRDDGNSYNAIDREGNLYQIVTANGLSSINAYAPDYSFKWRFEIPEKEGYRLLSSYSHFDLVIDSQRIIYWVTSNSFYNGPRLEQDALHAINPDGTLKWVYEFETYYRTSMPSIDNNGNVYIINNQRLMALDNMGNLMWNYDNLTNPDSVIVDNENTIYVSSNDRLLPAINSNGTLRWSFTVPADTTRYISYINTAVYGENQKTIYITTRDSYPRPPYVRSTVYSLDTDGSLRWSYNINNKIITNPIVDSQGVILLATARELYAINPDGTLKWIYNLSSYGQNYRYITLDTTGTVYLSDGNYIYAVGIDNIPPRISTLLNQESIFSPNNDGRSDVIGINFYSSERVNFTITIRDSFQNIIRAFSGSGEGPISQIWDGKNNDGSLVSDGIYTYTIEAVDLHNLPAISINNSIEVDTIPPQNPSFAIEGNEITTSRWINLAINAEDAMEMIISEFSDFRDVFWQEYKNTTDFLLSPLDGQKTIYVKFRDSSGNETLTVSDNITLDEYLLDRDVSISIREGNVVTQSLVHLFITAPGANQIKISEDPGFLGMDWIPFINSYEFNLSGTGRKIICIKFYDTVADRESGLFSVSVTYDPNASRDLSVSVREGNEVNTHKITLQLSALNATGMIISENPDFSEVEWTDYCPTRYFTLSPGNGNKTVYVKFRDREGIVTPVIFANVRVLVPILILDCGNPYSYYINNETKVKQYLQRKNYLFEYWPLFEQAFPTIEQLNTYDLVILTTNGVNENMIDFDILGQYLDTAGRLFISSDKLLSYSDIDDFIFNYLHITSFERFSGDILSLTLRGINNDPIVPVNVSLTDIANRLTKIELYNRSFYKIIPDDQTSSGIIMDNDNNYYGLRYPRELGQEQYRLVFFAFPSEIFEILYQDIRNFSFIYDNIIDYLIKSIFIEKVDIYTIQNYQKVVNPDSDIYVRFNTHLRPDTIVQENIILTGSISGIIPCTLTYDNNTRIVKINPNQTLNILETITLTITTDLRNTAETDLRNNYTYNFSINNLMEELQVISVIPSADTHDIPVNADIAIGFNSSLDESTINSNNITVTSVSLGILNGSFQYSSENNIVKFTPQNPFSFNDEIRVLITRGVRSMSGTALGGDYTFNFYTQAGDDIALPAINSLTADPVWFNNNIVYTARRPNTQIQATISKPSNWTIGIYDSNRQLIKTFSGVGNNISQVWNGRYTDPNGGVFPADEGEYIISVETIDGNGNMAQAETTIGIDRTSPRATVEIAEGDLAHNTQILLNITYLNEVISVLFGDYNNPSEDTPGWEAPVQQKTYIMDNREGAKNIKVFLLDRAGNISGVTNTIRLDLLPEITEYMADPSSISPNGDEINDSTEITAFGSEPLQWDFVIKNNTDQTVATYTSSGYENGLYFTWNGRDNAGSLMQDGVYTYYINGQDDEGNNIQQIQDNITIDTSAFAQGNITINEAPITNSQYITIAVNCPNADKMQISENMDFNGAEWILYTETLDFSLTNIEGLHTVYARFQNAAGNINQPVSADITLDTTPPQAVTINPVSTPTDNNNQIISGTKSEDTVRINIYGPVQITNLTYPTLTTWQADITLQEGFNEISVTAEDNIGNTSAPVNTTIYYSWNIEKPNIQITNPRNNSTVNNGTIIGRVSDLTATLEVNEIPVLINQQGMFNVNLDLLEGENTITAVATDRDGDAGTDTVRVIYDTTGPSIRITNPANGDIANITPITVIGTVSDVNLEDVSVNLIPAVISDGRFGAEGIELEAGENIITAEATDKTGNTSQTSIIIILRTDAQRFNLEEVYGSTIEIEPSQLPEAGSQHELKVRLYVDGEPVQNETIQYEVTEGHGQLVNSEVRTDNEGEASTWFTLDIDAGQINRITAYPVQCPQAKVEFIVQGRTAPSAQITKLTDETLTYIPNAEIELILKVMDQYNNPIPGEQISFTILSGNGQLFQETAETNEMGEAYIGYVTGPIAGVVNNIRAELSNNPAVSTAFNIQTIALPEGITVDSIINRVNENDNRIEDIQADITITSNASWTDPETRLHIWQKGDKQKVQMMFPKEMTLTRPPLDNRITFDGLNNYIISYNSGNQTYTIKTKQDGQQTIIPFELCLIDHDRGIILKTEYFVGNDTSYNRIVTEFWNYVEIDNTRIFTEKTENFYTGFNNYPSATREIYSNIQLNQGIQDSEFE